MNETWDRQCHYSSELVFTAKTSDLVANSWSIWWVTQTDQDLRTKKMLN